MVIRVTTNLKDWTKHKVLLNQNTKKRELWKGMRMESPRCLTTHQNRTMASYTKP